MRDGLQGNHSIQRRVHLCRAHRLGEKIIHPRLDTAFTIALAGECCQRDHAEVIIACLLPLSDRLDDLEAIYLRHVHVQQQQIKCALL